MLHSDLIRKYFSAYGGKDHKAVESLLSKVGIASDSGSLNRKGNQNGKV